MIGKELQDIASAIEPVLRKYRIAAAYIFGSYARGTMKENSDVDILIDYADIDIDLFQLADLAGELEATLGRKVDLVTVNSLNGDFFSNTVNREKICIYTASEP